LARTVDGRNHADLIVPDAPSANDICDDGRTNLIVTKGVIVERKMFSADFPHRGRLFVEKCVASAGYT